MNKIYFKAERPHLNSPMANVNIAVTVTGTINKEAISIALSRLMVIHPSLTAAVELDERGKAYLVLDKNPDITPVWIDNSKYGDVNQIILQYNSIPFDFVNGPLVRFIVIHNDESSTIVIQGHHIIGDGLAYTYLMRDLMDLLEGVSIDVREPSVLQNTNGFPDRSRPPFLFRYFVKSLNKKWRRNECYFTQEDYLKMYEDYHIGHHEAICDRTIEGEAYNKLIELCHNANVTVNSALTTAYVASIQQNLPEHKGIMQRIGIAVNVRDDIQGITEGSMGNYVSGIALQQMYDINKSFGDNARSMESVIHQSVSTQSGKFMALNLLMSIDDTLLDAFQYAAYSDYSDRTATQLANMLGEGLPVGGIGITNLGKDPVNFMNKNYIVQDLRFICPASPANDITIGVVSYNNRMNICLRYCDNLIPDDVVQTIHDQAMNYFRSDC